MFTKKLADFVAEVGSEDIPGPAIQIAKQGITDVIGVSLPGSMEPAAKTVADFARRLGGTAESSVIGCGLVTSPYLAALANGTIGHALDYDDGGGGIHASAVLGPAVLAMGESIGASGADILAAYVVGFEVAARLWQAVGSDHYEQGWHGTNTNGSLGAAAAVSWLLQLNAHQVRMALGIASSLAGGLRQNFGTMTKPLHAGNAAANGVMAAMLAEKGLTADENIIEERYGFAKVFGHPGDVDWEKATEGLGKSFSIASDSYLRLAFKRYPACAGTHASIDAALLLRQAHELAPDAIADIELGVNPRKRKVLIHHSPQTGLEAKFSLEYAVARALLSGEVQLRHFTDEAVNEPEVRSLMEKSRWVEKYPDPAGGYLENFGSKSVTVTLKDGRQYSRELHLSNGMFSLPLTAEDLAAKFRDCASEVLSPKEIDRSLNLLASFDTLENIKELMSIVASA